MEDLFLKLQRLGILLILIGFITVFAGSILLFMEAMQGMPSGSGALIVFIGPFPLALSWGEQGVMLLVAGLLIVLLMVLILVFFMRKPFQRLESDVK